MPIKYNWEKVGKLPTREDVYFQSNLKIYAKEIDHMYLVNLTEKEMKEMIKDGNLER